MSTNTDLYTSSETESSGSVIQYPHTMELRQIDPHTMRLRQIDPDLDVPPYFDPTSSYDNDLYSQSRLIFNELDEIKQLLNYHIAPVVKSFLVQNFSIIPAIKTALHRCHTFLTSFFETIRSDIKLEHAISNEIIQANYNIEIWEDPDFDDMPTPVLVISLPERPEYNIFTLWEQIDRMIYESIDLKLLLTSVREF